MAKDKLDKLDRVSQGAGLTQTVEEDPHKKKKIVDMKQKVVFIDPDWEKAFDEADMGMSLTAYIRRGFKKMLEEDGIFPHKNKG